jgi:hypothetical protein
LHFCRNRRTGQLVSVLRASEEVVNCVLPHPTESSFASSGIEHDVALWHPQLKDSQQETSSFVMKEEQMKKQVVVNQRALKDHQEEQSHMGPFAARGFQNAILQMLGGRHRGHQQAEDDD